METADMLLKRYKEDGMNFNFFHDLEQKIPLNTMTDDVIKKLYERNLFMLNSHTTGESTKKVNVVLLHILDDVIIHNRTKKINKIRNKNE